MSDGSEFQVCGAATENACRVNSVSVLTANSVGRLQRPNRNSGLDQVMHPPITSDSRCD